jgi:hypothetical protein
MLNYQAYLIRFWQEDAQSPWRAELEAADTGEKRRFSSPEQLFTFVMQRLQDDEPAAIDKFKKESIHNEKS